MIVQLTKTKTGKEFKDAPMDGNVKEQEHAPEEVLLPMASAQVTLFALSLGHSTSMMLTVTSSGTKAIKKLLMAITNIKTN
jgi:hypothetical protein